MRGMRGHGEGMGGMGGECGEIWGGWGVGWGGLWVSPSLCCARRRSSRGTRVPSTFLQGHRGGGERKGGVGGGRVTMRHVTPRHVTPYRDRSRRRRRHSRGVGVAAGGDAALRPRLQHVLRGHHHIELPWGGGQSGVGTPKAVWGPQSSTRVCVPSPPPPLLGAYNPLQPPPPKKMLGTLPQTLLGPPQTPLGPPKPH